MRLTEVTVQNYRSITSQTRFQVGELTTLVGPNNEGKSNLLRALALGMAVIERWSQIPARIARQSELVGPDSFGVLRPRPLRRTGGQEIGYRWADDYPLGKQETRGAHPTVLRLRFQLSNEEIREFTDATGIANNGELPIELRLNRLSASFGVVKPGRGAATHRAKAKEIAAFITSKLSFVSVPAIRTGEQALTLVNDLARVRMRALTESEQYRRLTSDLNALRNDAVQVIGSDLAKSVRQYLPSIRGINIVTADVEQADTADELQIDDGTITSIASKGDGIKSLITMALIHALAQERSRSHTFILAVDEPEAHLHPSSIHELQVLFQELSQKQQVILATHHPIFVNRDQVASNVLVIGNEAKSARSVAQIRSAIGVELHDNLQSAETVVLVEGITDERTLPALLAEVDQRWKSVIQTGQVVFRATKGAGKMRAQIQREKSTVCRILVVLDDDSAGRDESRRIRDSSILLDQHIFMLRDSSRQSSELEDLIEPDVYLEALSQKLGRTFTSQHFANKARKWTENLQEAARTLGASLSGVELDDLAKSAVSTAVQSAQTQRAKSEVRTHLLSLSDLILGSKIS